MNKKMRHRNIAAASIMAIASFGLSVNASAGVLASGVKTMSCSQGHEKKLETVKTPGNRVLKVRSVSASSNKTTNFRLYNPDSQQYTVWKAAGSGATVQWDTLLGSRYEGRADAWKTTDCNGRSLGNGNYHLTWEMQG